MGRREDGWRPSLPAEPKSINRALTTGAGRLDEDSAQRPRLLNIERALVHMLAPEPA
jgi:hypothetical protein